jgi:CBS domain-containing protein
MNVAEILAQKSGAVETVGAGEPIRNAIGRFLGVKVRCLVVLDGAQVAGVVTMRDLLRALQSGDGSQDQPVRAAMSAGPVTVTPETPVDEAQSLIASRDINHLPVVDGGKLVGVLTLADILRTVLDDVAGLNADLRRYIHSPYAL